MTILNKENGISNVFLLEGKSDNTWNYVTNLIKENLNVDITKENIDTSIVDCIELDVKHLRELLLSTLMKPRGNYKVYILQNGEGLTTIMQNAMLKTLEEPPEYACFCILCENVGGILPTLKSRCNYVYVTADVDEDCQIQDSSRKIIDCIYNEQYGAVFQEIKTLSKRDDAIRFTEDFLRYLESNSDDNTKKFYDTKYKVVNLVEEARLLINGNCNCSASLDAMVLNILEVLDGNSGRN